MRSVSSIALCVAVFGMPLAAKAQTPETSKGSQSASAPLKTIAEDASVEQQSDQNAIGDIVVTAQRREESLQRVPIAVSVLTGEALSASGIQTTAQLATLVPSLNYSANAGFANPYLRGVGSDITLPNADASVATYVDGVYISTNSAIIQNLLEVERVEVLKGPQGTLFGRNAVGGAINIVTPSPGDTLKGRVRFGYGNFDQVDASGFVSGPITDSISAGVYGGVSRADSYTKRKIPRAIREPSNEFDAGVRGKLVFDKGGPLVLTATAEYLRADHYDGSPYRLIQANGIGTAFGGSLTPYGVIANDYPAFFKSKQGNFSLKGELDLTAVRLVTISGYRHFRSDNSLDVDGTEAPLLGVTASVYSDQYSQELQLLSPPGSNLTWIIGAYAFYEETGLDPSAVRGVVFAPLTGLDATAGVESTSFAGFGQLTVPIGERLRVTAGARLTRDYKKFSGRQAFLSAAGTVAQTFPDDEKGWTKFTPKLTIDYQLDRVLLYATFSQGYKAGAYNLGVPSTPGPVNPENLTAYEAGIKSDLFDRRLRVNLAGYYYTFDDLQVQIADPLTGGARLQNAASARYYGVEADIVAIPVTGLTLTGSVSFESSKYTSFPNYGGFLPAPLGNSNSAPIDVTGFRTQRTPKFVGTLAATYRGDIGNLGKFEVSLDGYHNSGFTWEPAGVIRERKYNLLNGSVALLAQDGWSLRLWGRNLTKTKYSALKSINNFGSYSVDAAPRTYGLTGTFSY